MKELIVPILIVLTCIWLVRRRGKRRAKRMLLRLAADSGMIFRAGGLLDPPRAISPSGGHSVELALVPTSWRGQAFLAEFRGPWTHYRPPLVRSTPADPQVAVPANQLAPHPLVAMTLHADTHSPDASNIIGTSLPITQPLVQLGQQVSLHGQSATLRTEDNWFYLTARIPPMPPVEMARWFHMVTHYYRGLLAETEAGIQFSGQPAEVDLAEVDCQVCGTEIAAEERVLCAACGAPHHQECWTYNGGCAIYGCRCHEIRAESARQLGI